MKHIWIMNRNRSHTKEASACVGRAVVQNGLRKAGRSGRQAPAPEGLRSRKAVSHAPREFGRAGRMLVNR